MIKRLQQITGVGCYAACRSPQVQFEAMALIYGENCYGKSTLSDILRSLAENNPTYITERASLPPVAGGGQHVQVSIIIPGQVQETTFTFRQGTWNPTLPDSVRIDVFDNDFIHRNLFTGLSIERQNQENITRFILGDTGVRTAQRIGDINSELRGVNKNLRDAEAGVFAGISDLPAFFQLDQPHDLPTLDRLISERTASVQTDRRLAADLTTARRRQEPTLCPSAPSIGSILELIIRCLSSTYQQVHRDAEARLAEHLRNHTPDPVRSRNWVRQGATLIRDDECPFCGQRLLGTAGALISAYQAIFNEAFEQYVSDIIANLETAKQEFASDTCSNLPLLIEQNRVAYFQYPELLTRPGTQELIQRLNTEADEVLRRHAQWVVMHDLYMQSLSEAVQCKRENAHIAIPSPDSAELVRNIAVLERAVGEYNQCVRLLSAEITEFKASLDANQVEGRIREGERDIGKLRLYKRRLDSELACRSYSDKVVRRNTLEAEATHLQNELDREQAAFLTRYFRAINTVFTALGSNRFIISAEPSRRGNMPTIQLRVFYNGIPITQDRLHSCFSESDRRALAFAIFWARIEMRNPTERLCTIVVLDDPVTSFDDARIDRTIRLIEAQLPNLRQIIILSHYSAYLKAFFARLNGQYNSMLLATLYQDATGTQMRRADPLDFTETDHQRAYRRISTFIDREHTEDVFQDLRVFLETEVRARYYQGIIENNLRAMQFASLLDELARLGIMSNESRRAIEPLRLTLNADHHVWTSRSQEEKIGIARDVLRLVYEDL